MKEYYIPALRLSSCGTDFAGPPVRSIKQFLTAKKILQKVFRSNLEDIDRVIMRDAMIKSLGQRIIASKMRIVDILRAS